MKALEALKGALEASRAEGLPLILLRERALEAAAAASPGDYDLLAPDGALERVLEVWHSSLLGTDASYLVHYSKPEKRHIVLFDTSGEPDGNAGGGGGRTIDVDLWREHRIDVPAGARRDTRVLRHSALAPHCALAGGLLRMAPWLELTVYLCHLYEKKKDLASEGVRDRLRFYAEASRSWGLASGTDRSSDPLSASGPLEQLRSLPSRLLDGHADAVDAARVGTGILDRLGMIQERPRTAERTRWWWRRKSRSLSRRLGAGPVISVQGPDGSGKTTIISAMLAAAERRGGALEPVVFKRLYRRSVFRFLYKTVRKLRRLRNRQEPKEVVEVALAPFLFAGALINYRLALAFGGRGRIRVFDRFFPDLLVTNRKEQGGSLGFTWSYRLLRRLMPQSSCAVLLATRPEALLARKAEMSAENARRYLLLMASHYTRFPPADLLVLRTDIPLERSVAVLEKALEGVR